MGCLLAVQSGRVQAFDPFNRPPSASVGAVCRSGTSGSPACPAKGSTTYNANPFVGNNGILIKSSLMLSWIIGITAVAMIAFGGLQYIMSRGDAQKAVNARNTILYSCAGLVIAVLGQAIVAFVVNRVN